MKEATGEGSMTIITIVIIASLAVAAGIVVSIMMTNAKTKANTIDTNVNVDTNYKGPTPS